MDLRGAKAQYFKEQAEKGIREIFARQREIASERIYRTQEGMKSRSGRLMESLTNPKYSVSTPGEGLQAETEVPTYIRFLDMKRYGNHRIYNRQIWGILYKETLQNIKYEFRDWIRECFPELLEQVNNQK